MPTALGALGTFFPPVLWMYVEVFSLPHWKEQSPQALLSLVHVHLTLPVLPSQEIFLRKVPHRSELAA